MNPFTILIVDDERTLARSIKLFLADHGYEAEVAENGEKALELLERLRPDLVFLDMNLPGISGLDLLKRINRHSSLSIHLSLISTDRELARTSVPLRS